MSNFDDLMKREASPPLVLSELSGCSYDTARQVVQGDRDLSIKWVQALMAKLKLPFEEVLAFVSHLRKVWASRKPDPTPTSPKEEVGG